MVRGGSFGDAGTGLWRLEQEGGEECVETQAAFEGGGEAVGGVGEIAGVDGLFERVLVERGGEGLASSGLEAGGIDAFGEAETHHQHFAATVGRGDLLLGGAAVAVVFDALGPGFGGAVAAGGDQVVAEGEAAVGAGADAGVVLVAPIGEIVAAFGTGPGEVADLVGSKAVVGAGFDCVVVEGGGAVVVGQGDLALAVAGLEGGAGLDGELVETEVVGAEGEGLAEFGGPGGAVLLRAGVNEVEADAGEGGAGVSKGVDGLGGRVRRGRRSLGFGRQGRLG